MWWSEPFVTLGDQAALEVTATHGAVLDEVSLDRCSGGPGAEGSSLNGVVPRLRAEPESGATGPDRMAEVVIALDLVPVVPAVAPLIDVVSEASAVVADG